MTKIQITVFDLLENPILRNLCRTDESSFNAIFTIIVDGKSYVNTR